MNKSILAIVVIGAGVAVATQAHAQKEAMGMFYEIQMAPAVCKWVGAADSKKLDATILAQEKALGVTAADRTAMQKAAEADLRSDPSNCAADGMMRPMYDEAVK